MNRPNCFIVGASKCGTSALSDYLRTHPNIFMSFPKEPAYFTEFPYPRFRVVREERDYLNLFKKAADAEEVVCEATASYLYDPDSMDRIHRFDPNAKIVAMFRNPVDMVYAWHSQLLYSYEELEPDFEKAWRMQSERAAQRNIPKRCRDYRILLYAEVGAFGSQLERLYAYFPRDQVQVILLEDLMADAKEVYEKVLAFLELPSDGRTEFPVVNESKEHADTWWGRFSAQPPQTWIWTSRLIKKATGIEHFGIMERLRERTARVRKRRHLEPAFRRELTLTFEPEIRKLGRLLERDLAHWLDTKLTKT